MTLAVNSTYKVSGMTCSHCVTAVTNELMLIPGVSKVVVNLESGDVNVTSDHELESKEVNAAIDEAGYELVAQ